MSRTYRLHLEHAGRPVSPTLIAWSRTELEPRSFTRWLRRRWLILRMSEQEFATVRRGALARAWSTRKRLARAHRHTPLTDEQLNHMTRKELTR
jgi:hypothetical protein